MRLDSLTFKTSRDRDNRWITRCPQLDIRSIGKTRADSIKTCIDKSFRRFYEIDCERRFPTPEGTPV